MADFLFDSTDPEMIALRSEYFDGVLDKVTAVEAGILALEKGEQWERSLENILGDIHSIKGSAGSFGVAFLASICHHLEDFIALLPATKRGKLNKSDSDHILKILDGVVIIVKSEIRLSRGSDSEVKRGRDLAIAEVDHVIRNAPRVARNVRVLFIDYSKTAYLLLMREITAAPLKVDFCSDGLEGLMECLNQPYDFVVCGNNLKSLNGRAILAAIQLQLGRHRPVTVFIGSIPEEEKDLFKPNHVVARSSQLAQDLLQIISSSSPTRESLTIAS